MKCVFIVFILCFSLSFSKRMKKAPCSTFKPNLTPLTFNTINDANITPDACKQSAVKDLAERIAIKNNYSDCTLKDTWGPYPKLYNKANLPDKCDKEVFSQARVLGAIQVIIDQKYNYCHHHSPQWLPPDSKGADGKYTYRKLLDSLKIAQGDDDGVCSNAYPNASIENVSTWTGIDCSHFTNLVYNLSFGVFIDTNVNLQACSNTSESLAVSAFLPFTRDDQSKFQVGDLLYVAKKGSDVLNISHVILWTGYKLGDGEKFTKEALLSWLPNKEKDTYSKAIDANLKSGKPVYVIADSHFAGPNYRPFVGWYYTAFSHARRIIGKEKIGDPAANIPAGTKIDSDNHCSTNNRK